MPLLSKGQPQFTEAKVRHEQAIAKARIQVERAIQRVKRFRIFNSLSPDNADDLFLISPLSSTFLTTASIREAVTIPGIVSNQASFVDCPHVLSATSFH